MKTCPLCGNTMQDEDQFCTGCGSSQEGATEKPVTASALETGATPDLAVEQSCDEAAPAQPKQEQPQAPMNAIPLPDLTASTAQPPLLAAQQPAEPVIPQPPHTATQANSFQGAVPLAPPVQPALFAQEQSGGARPLYGGQAAYGQAPQNTYVPYGNGAMPPPPMQQSGMYQTPPMPSYYQNDTVGLGEWLLNYLIMAIPIVNIIMLCVWGFGSSAKPSVRNWARASLIWMGIGVVLAVLFVAATAIIVNSMLPYGY